MARSDPTAENWAESSGPFSNFAERLSLDRILQRGPVPLSREWRRLCRAAGARLAFCEKAPMRSCGEASCAAVVEQNSSARRVAVAVRYTRIGHLISVRHATHLIWCRALVITRKPPMHIPESAHLWALFAAGHGLHVLKRAEPLRKIAALWNKNAPRMAAHQCADARHPPLRQRRRLFLLARAPRRRHASRPHAGHPLQPHHRAKPRQRRNVRPLRRQHGRLGRRQNPFPAKGNPGYPVAVILSEVRARPCLSRSSAGARKQSKDLSWIENVAAA